MGARHELTQHMFTKTMNVQVWKPEFERFVFVPFRHYDPLLKLFCRAGRHFVYTSRYTMFFTRLLLQLNDKASIESLARRVRKKPTEFYEHTKVWGEVFEAYIKVSLDGTIITLMLTYYFLGSPSHRTDSRS